MGQQARTPDAPAPNALGELRALLFGAESRRLDALDAELRALAASRLAKDDLRQATAAVIADALREAEVRDHRALANALAPLVVAAIRAEIRNSREEMVEALYPLVGRLVSAAVADGLRRVTETIAERVDQLVSARRWRWRFTALMTGRSVGEVALAESQRARVTRVLCLERGSGQLIAVWPQAESDGRSDLMSGLIAAITEFAATTFAKEGGSLRALDLGARRVLLRSSATVIVAAECEGVLRPQDESAVDGAFLTLLGVHDRMQAIDADDLSSLDAALEQAAPAPRRSPVAIWATRLAGVALAVWLGWSLALAGLHWFRERRVERALEAARAADPADAAFPARLIFDHKAGRVTLAGLVASQAQEDRLLNALRGPAEPYALDARIEVVASSAALARQAEALTREAEGLAANAKAARERLASALEAGRAAAANRAAADRADLETRLTQERASLESRIAQAAGEATAGRETLARDLAAARAELAAARAAATAPERLLREEAATAAIFFAVGGAELVDPTAAGKVVDRLAALMAKTTTRLRLVGHTDNGGSESLNRRLSMRRAQAVADLMIARGVARERLIIVSRLAETRLSEDPDGAANRRVTFELPLQDEPSR